MSSSKRCKFCDNVFQSKTSLNTHQKTAKYCLKIQNKTTEKTFFESPNCETCLTSKYRLERHVEICKKTADVTIKTLYAENNKLKQLLIEKETLIEVLQSENRIYKEMSDNAQTTITEIAKQPKTQNTQNNKFVLNPLDLSQEKILKALEDNYTTDHFFEGQKGLAKFTVDHLLKDKDGQLTYVCTDPSRHIYKFKTVNGDIERDIRAAKLTGMLAEKAKKHTHRIASEGMESADAEQFILLTDNFREIKELEEDNTEFRGVLSSLTTVK